MGSCSSGTVNSKASKKTGTLIKYANCIEMDSLKDGVIAHLIQPEIKDTFKFYLSSQPTHTPIGYTFLKVPITNLSVLSSTQVGMLDKLNCIPLISSISDKRFVYNRRLKKQLIERKTVSIGQLDNVSIEQLLKSSPQAILFSGFSGELPQSEVLKKAHISPIPIFDWKEQHPLGKAEWIKFIGYLVGKPNEANDYFMELDVRYNRLKRSNTNTGPSIFCGNLTGDIWYTPTGQSYQAKLLMDAGANYQYAKTQGVGSLSFSIEQVIKDNLSTEIWLNPGMHEMKQLKTIHPMVRHFKSVKTNKVYCYSHAMNKYWELAAIEPDKVLSDLIQLVHFNGKGTEKLYFYAKVSN